MGILRTKSATPTTAEERAQLASLDALNALTVFTDTLTVLDGAVDQLREAEFEAHNEADRHRAIAMSAYQERQRHAKVADRFRALLGEAA